MSNWGIYSVPAYSGEWYSRNMYIQGSREFEHHIATYGVHKDFGYKDFIPMFTAEKFDPEEWADLFRKAGAKYVVPVAEYHDGFQMYKSDISHWNAYEMGLKRDILGELKKAFEKNGMVIGASSHRVEHWFFMGIEVVVNYKHDASKKPLFHGIIKGIEVLEFREIPKWVRDESGLHIYTETVKSEHSIVLKIKID